MMYLEIDRAHVAKGSTTELVCRRLNIVRYIEDLRESASDCTESIQVAWSMVDQCYT
jgi:hypothetical protein